MICGCCCDDDDDDDDEAEAWFSAARCRCCCCCAHGEGKCDDAAGVGLEADGELRGAREVELAIAGSW